MVTPTCWSVHSTQELAIAHGLGELYETSLCLLVTTCFKTRIHHQTLLHPLNQQTPFINLAVAQQQPIRDGYKVLQLLQSGRRGNVPTALTSCVLRSDWTESVWKPHRLSKISGSFNPFNEKEAPASGWPLSLFFIFLFCRYICSL